MKQYKTRKALIEEFSNIKTKLLKTEDKQKAMGDFSIFLRRMALKSFPREQVAHLKGEEWLLCLDTMMECEIFSKGKGRVLITAPYDKHFSEDVSELFPWVEGWIQKKF